MPCHTLIEIADQRLSLVAKYLGLAKANRAAALDRVPLSGSLDHHRHLVRPLKIGCLSEMYGVSLDERAVIINQHALPEHQVLQPQIIARGVLGLLRRLHDLHLRVRV